MKKMIRFLEESSKLNNKEQLKSYYNVVLYEE